MTTPVDGRLDSWSVHSELEWPTLLAGNGLSINMWDGFAYSSLFANASLSAPAQAIFDELGTTNFEQCLECLHHAAIALRALQEPVQAVEEAYVAVRDALFAAVGDVHVPWDEFPQAVHDHLAREVNRFERVFTTNYDLCMYWSQLQTEVSVDIIDFFWSAGNVFDPGDAEPRSRRSTRMYYLHGGLHLWQDDESGENGKWTRSQGPLLDLGSKYGPKSSRRPLFVSEGTAAAKVRTIRQSNYLSFCLEELRSDNSPTLVFGHSLAPQDSHVVAALANGAPRRIAVAIYPSGDESAVLAEKARILQALDGHRVLFFDSTTHPLGQSRLHIGGTPQDP